MLGDLDNDPMGGRGEDPREFRMHHGSVRRVHRQVRVGRDQGKRVESRADRDELEVDAEGQARGLREPQVGRSVRLRGEPGERLDADVRSTREVHDRLEDHPEVLARDEPPDPGGLLAAVDRVVLLAQQLRRELAEDAVDHFRRERGSALSDANLTAFGEHVLDRIDDLVHAGPFDEVADRAGAEHLEDGRTVLEGG